MKIALIGYGKMGHIIERIAKERGHEIVATIDINNMQDFDSASFRSADAAIEFTTPGTAVDNYMRCFKAGVPVVSGTTGWTKRMDEVKEACQKANGSFFYSSNFSIGVNIFFAVNKYLAKIMDSFKQYDVEMTETHHIHKLDKPSGTAITIAEQIIDNRSDKTGWALDKADSKDEIAIHAIREGEVPGIHEVRYTSAEDIITIRHEAKNREGFALGAVMAAEFIKGKKGIFGMNDLFKF
jgi:4-hydroxy-tetrahydrodipicolinate reductase